MGGFYGSVFIRTDDRSPVIAALADIARPAKVRFLVTPPDRGWVAAYPDGSGQDEGIARRIARQLADDIVYLMSHDEDIFSYLVFRKGRLVDRYDSNPDVFREVSAAVRRKRRGRPGLFADLFPTPEALTSAAELLARPKERVYSSELMVRFAELLGLPHDTMTSYEYLREEEPDDFPGWAEFVHVPDISRELARGRLGVAEVEERRRREFDEGRLLVELWAEEPDFLAHPIACPDHSGTGFLVSAHTVLWAAERTVTIERVAPPWSAGPRPSGLSVEAGIWIVEASPSRRYLAIAQGSGDRWRLDVRDQATGQLLPTPRLPDALQSLAFAPDETRWVGTSKEGVVVAPLDGGEPTVWPIPEATTPAIHPAGEILVVAKSVSNRLVFIELASGRVLKTLMLGGGSQMRGLLVEIRVYPELARLYAGFIAGQDQGPLQALSRQHQDDLRGRIGRDGVRVEHFAERAEGEPFAKARDLLNELGRVRNQWKRAFSDQVGQYLAAYDVQPTPARSTETASTEDDVESMFPGAETALRLRFDPDGRFLFAATDAGVRVYAWEELAIAAGATPRPAFSAVPDPLIERDGDRVVSTHQGVYDLAYDAPRRRLLYATMGGQVGRLDLDDGRSGVLLEPPGRPPLMALHLSGDRSALCVTCHPNRFGRNRGTKRASVQVWDYRRLTERPETADSGR